MWDLSCFWPLVPYKQRVFFFARTLEGSDGCSWDKKKTKHPRHKIGGKHIGAITCASASLPPIRWDGGAGGSVAHWNLPQREERGDEQSAGRGQHGGGVLHAGGSHGSVINHLHLWTFVLLAAAFLLHGRVLWKARGHLLYQQSECALFWVWPFVSWQKDQSSSCGWSVLGPSGESDDSPDLPVAYLVHAVESREALSYRATKANATQQEILQKQCLWIHNAIPKVNKWIKRMKKYKFFFIWRYIYLTMLESRLHFCSSTKDQDKQGFRNQPSSFCLWQN